MTSSPSFSPHSKLVVIAALVVAAACGGRTTIDDSGEIGAGGSTNDQGGTSSMTGTTMTTGTTTTTGGFSTGAAGVSTTTGGFGTGGATTSGGFAGSGQPGSGGAAGGSTCQNVPCPDIACGPGSQFAMVPGACCPSCQPCNVGCPRFDCVPGSHFEGTPGQCCGSCVPDPKSCDQGRKDYEVFRAQLLDKYSSSSCMSDGICVIASEINSCENSCGVALPIANADSWKSNLISFAQSNCSNCPPMPLPGCPARVARCRMNRCVLDLAGTQ